MDVITRNFLRFLRIGLFKNEETIEPMSAWKWQRMAQHAAMHDVVALLYRGITMSKSQFFVQPTEALDHQWRQTAIEQRNRHARLFSGLGPLISALAPLQLRPVLLGPLAMSLAYDVPEDRQASAIDLFFPYETKGRKADQWAWTQGTDVAMTDHHALSYSFNGLPVRHHQRLLPMSNALHAHTLASIVDDEFRECRPTLVDVGDLRMELPSPTLLLLRQMLAVANDILSGGVHLARLADAAVFLRNKGHLVDFVKLQQWIERLRLGTMAQLQGALLCHLFGMSTDEVPFMDDDHQLDLTSFDEHLFDLRDSSQSWKLRQASGNVFVSAIGSKALFRQVRHSAHYLRYYPTEGLAVLTSAFAHSLSDVEE